MKLSKRLNAIKELVPAGTVLADIGCDHAYLPCACIEEGRCIKAYACDINEGPLKRAQQNIDENGMKEQVKAILCAGLSECPQDVDTVVISGMGYETIKMILENDYERLSQFKTLILQSNSDVDLLRKWLGDHQFNIIDEKLVFDVHYYQILKVTVTGGRKLNETECMFGIHMPKEELFQEYWQFRKDKVAAILSQLDENHQKYSEMSDFFNKIEAQLKTSS